MKKVKDKWYLNQSEVGCYGSSQNSRGRKKARQSRIHDITSTQMTLVHYPTNTEVTGQILEGNYSRKEMKKLKEKLTNKLLIELETQVAKKLKVKGL